MTRRLLVLCLSLPLSLSLVAAADPCVSGVPVGKRPWGIAVTPDGKRLYTANGLSGDVSVLDTATLKVIATIPAGEGAWPSTPCSNCCKEPASRAPPAKIAGRRLNYRTSSTTSCRRTTLLSARNRRA